MTTWDPTAMPGRSATGRFATRPACAIPELQFLAFAPIADSALKHGQLRIALYFQDEVVRVLTGSKAPVLLSDAFFWHGLILHHLGEHRRAQEDLRLAASYLGQQTDPDVRRRTEADIALIEGGIALGSDPGRAGSPSSPPLSPSTGRGNFLRCPSSPIRREPRPFSSSGGTRSRRG